MIRHIAIRREDYNRWERRAPLVPDDLAALVEQHGLSFIVQTSDIRAYEDDAYRAAGAVVGEDIDRAEMVIAVKEVPIDLIRPGRVYVNFAHVIKGQRNNMPTLQRLIEQGCSLVDYERIVDDHGRRLIFFSQHAGYAGMIETLWALGQRQAARGLNTPLSDVRHAFEYSRLDDAKAHLDALGDRLRARPRAGSLVVGISGEGNVSKGAQEVLACLGVTEVAPEDLAEAARDPAGPPVVKVVFGERHMVRPVADGASFDLDEYYQHPERYQSQFERYLPHLDALVNAIYWEERYPRLVTREWAQRTWAAAKRPRLEVIGDISCDVEGAIELTVKETAPDVPCYVFEPATSAIKDGVSGDGPAIMAVYNLPCELPWESSKSFSGVLKDLVPPLAAADWSVDYDALALPAELKRAVIVQRGVLTPPFEYLKPYLPA